MCSDEALQGAETAGEVASPGAEVGNVASDGGADEVATDDGMGDDGGDAFRQDVTMTDGPSEGGTAADATRGTDGSGDRLTPDVTNEDTTSADSPGDVATPVDACVATGAEICTNGIDDDCNGLTDCADPACSAYTCVLPAPSGWTGPVALWQAMGSATAPGCQSGFGNPIDTNAGLTFSPASCGSCTCSASGQTCSPAGTFHPDQACAMATCASATPASDGTCTAVASNSCGSGGSFAMGAALPMPSGGSCTTNAGSVTVPPVSWTTSARICSYTGPTDTPGGCTSGGNQCVLAPTGNYGSTLCIFSSMNPAPTSCPTGYAVMGPFVFYAGAADTRGCGGCACAGAPTGGSCSGTVSLYGTSAGGCSGTPATYTLGSACQCYGGCSQPSLAAAPGYVKAGYTVAAGTCSVTAQPTPNGMVVPTGPTTVCCM
jgi:hypothetical protein